MNSTSHRQVKDLEDVVVIGYQTCPCFAPVTEAMPKFRDIHISNIVCDGAEEGIFVRGLPEMDIAQPRTLCK